MSVNVVYTAGAIAVGGRDGNTGTTDGRFEVKLARPKELGGKGDGNNPEQLFAAGYAACFLSSMQFVASQAGPRFRPMPRCRPPWGSGHALKAALVLRLPSTSRCPASAAARRKR